MDKRKYMRFDILLDAFCRGGNGTKKLKVNNFSREGAGLCGSDRLREGEDVEIEVSIPGDNIPVVISGQIAWSTDSKSKGDEYEHGVKFKEIKDSDRGKILEYIYKKWMMPSKNNKK
jgi:hypothetical protein